jgi:hypothetical protein
MALLALAAYDISGQPGAAVGTVGTGPPQRLLYQWQAYRVGWVSSMCVTPQGDLWTGSSRGNIRVWELHRGSADSGEHLRGGPARVAAAKPEGAPLAWELPVHLALRVCWCEQADIVGPALWRLVSTWLGLQ